MNSERESRYPLLAWARAAERNCAGREAWVGSNRRRNQRPEREVNPIRSVQWASSLGTSEACGVSREPEARRDMSKRVHRTLHTWLGQAGGEGYMWTMRELPARQAGVHGPEGSEEPGGSSQSARSSEEAGNDRGAKGRRKEKP